MQTLITQQVVVLFYFCLCLFEIYLVYNLLLELPSHTDVLGLMQLIYIDNPFITILLFMYHSIDLTVLSRLMVYDLLYDFIILKLVSRVCSHKRFLEYDILAFKWTIVKIYSTKLFWGHFFFSILRSLDELVN